MGITSAAEAKLDARIRPDITQLRSRTSYPRRHRPPLSVIAGGTDPGGRPAGGFAPTESSEMFARSSAETISRTVRAEQTTWRIARSDRTTAAQAATARKVTGAGAPAARRRPSRIASAGVASAGVASAGVASAGSASASIRLTKRGRIVLAALLTMIVAALTILIWLAVAGQAQAASHAGPGGPVGRSMLRVVVQPGQTLWGIAEKSDPAADPRVVIQQIMDDNSLAGTAIAAGQVLWVPRS